MSSKTQSSELSGSASHLIDYKNKEEVDCYVQQYKSVYKPFVSFERIEKAVQNAKLEYGNFKNVELYNSLGFELLLDSTDLMITTCKLTESEDQISTIYAFIYTEINEHDKYISQNDIVDEKIIYRYYSIGSSYLSRDGEYRGNLNTFTGLYRLKNELPGIWKTITEYIVHKFHKRKYKITFEHFYPTNKHATFNDSLEISIREHRFPMDLFVLSWYLHISRTIRKELPQNMNPKFGLLMQKYIKDDIAFITNVTRSYPLMRKIQHLCLDFKPHVRFGQKLIPLNLAEVENPFDILYKPWREFIVTAFISNLVINNICSSFPLVNSWLYMRNIKKGLFDNAIQYDKLDKSDSTKEIINIMLQAHKYTQHIESDIKKSKNLGKSWLEYKFNILGNAIHKSIDYAKRELIMSDTVIGIILSRIGQTFIDALKWSKQKGVDLTKKDNCEIFIRHVFEICYALYCVHDIYGIIHADLHLNNISLNNNYAPTYGGRKNMAVKEEDPSNTQTFTKDQKMSKLTKWSLLGMTSDSASVEKENLMFKEDVTVDTLFDIAQIDNPLVLYILDDDTDAQFIFPTNGFQACIFDFSRCIVHPTKAIEMHLPALPKSYAPVSDLHKFTKDQIDKMVGLCISLIPDYADKEEDLHTLFKNNFDAAFKLLSVADILGFTQKLLIYFTKEEKLCLESLNILKKINKLADSYLSFELNNLLHDPHYVKTILNMEKPMYAIMKEVFHDYTVQFYPKKINGNIVDMYVFNNDIKYSLNQYESYPEYLTKPCPSLKQDKRYDEIASQIKNRVSILEKFDKKQLLNLKMINYIANRHREKYF